MPRGPRNLRVAFNGVGLTQFGGVTLIEHFFQRLRLQRAFSRHIRFAQRNNRYSISESLEALLYPLILGLGRIETTEPLRWNGVFHYLAGLPGYPQASSLRRFLQRLAHAGRNALVRLHDRWRVAMLGHPAQVIFDLDSTVLTVPKQTFDQCVDSFGKLKDAADLLGLYGVASSVGGFLTNVVGTGGPLAVQRGAAITVANLEKELAPSAARLGIAASEVTLAVPASQSGALVKLLSSAKTVGAVAGSVAKFSGYVTVGATAVSLSIRGYCLLKTRGN